VLVDTIPDDPVERRDHLVALGLEAGLDRVGIAGVEPFEEVRSDLEERKASGMSGGLTFTYNDPGRSTDVRASLPWAERLVVGGRAYVPEAGSPGPARPGFGRIARFAVDDAYQPLGRALEVVAGALTAAGFRAEIVSDDNRLVDRAAAVRAGIGWWGRNAMVLAPGQGPWMLIGSVVTDAAVAPSEPMRRDCGTCEACLPACPTGALVAPGILDARLCLAARAQLPGAIPDELREPMGDRIYGCDDCLAACPPGGRALERAEAGRGEVDLVWLLEAGDDELLAAFDRFYLPRRRPATLRRNALVALGNHGDRGHLGVVERYLDHPDGVLAEQARWSVDRIGTRLSGAQSFASGK
jgi:epoxyqueuosine reductase